MLDERQRERARSALVEFVLVVRRSYLRAGANPIKHWEQLQNRALSAVRRAGSVDEWTTLLPRGLQLPTTLDSTGSSAIWELSKVAQDIGHTAVLDLMEREAGLIMAMARKLAEERADERKAAANE